MKKSKEKKEIVESVYKKMNRKYRFLFVLAGGYLLIMLSACETANTITYSWKAVNDRVWVGEAFWANRLQDWQINDGRLESVVTEGNLPLRNVHCITAQLKPDPEDLNLSVRAGITDERDQVRAGALCGFLLGAGGSDLDYRAASLIHHSSAPNAGLLIGVTGEGNLFYGKDAAVPERQGGKRVPTPEILQSLTLHVEGAHRGEQYILKVTLRDTELQVHDTLSLATDPSILTGNIALVSHSGFGEDPVNFWFNDLSIGGGKVAYQPDQSLGPILFSMYTLSDHTLKLSAQMMPMSDKDHNEVAFQVKENGQWKTLDQASFAYPSYNAIFKIENWDASGSQPYRIAYEPAEDAQMRDQGYWEGVIQAEPTGKDTLRTASFACIGHSMSGMHERGHLPGWTNWNYEVFDHMRAHWSDDNLFTSENIWFPHQKVVDKIKFQKPDIMFFLGDQVYEFRPTMGEYERGHITILDYLYKWYLWGWSFREVINEIPTVAIPDDHDVYQGNIWGDAGKKSPEGNRWKDGGYTEPPEFVNMVQRTMCGNLPDPYDPTPVAQDIGVYYTALNYGGVSFAILEDRKFKSSPGSKGPGLKLLGDRQISFLEDWTASWKEQTMFKVAMTQTLFAGVHTVYGEINRDEDTNGWPVEGRNRALQALRKGFAFSIGGDQHLATVVHHGIDTWGDAGYSIIAQAIGCVYPRFWEPKAPPVDGDIYGTKYLGKYLDAFGNHVDIRAVANPYVTKVKPYAQNDLAVGYVVVDFVKSSQEIIMENWPVWADLSQGDREQFEGWPMKIHLRDNYSREPLYYLPALEFESMKDPFIQVIEEATGEIIYSLRVTDEQFLPGVFSQGEYSVKIGKSSEDIQRVIKQLKATDRDTAIKNAEKI